MKEGLKDFISTFLSIVLCFLIVFLFGVMELKNSLKKDTVRNVIKNTDLITDVKEKEETKQIKDLFEDVYVTAEKYQIPDKFVDAVLNDKTTKDFFGKVAANVIDSTITGKDSKILTPEEFNQLLDDNIDHFIEVSNVQLTEKQKEKFLDLAKEHSSTIINVLPTAKQLQVNIKPEIISGIQFITGNTLFMILLGTIIICSIIIVIFKWKRSEWLLYFATPILFSGIMILFIGYMAPNLFNMVLNFNNDLLYLFVDQFASHIKQGFMTIGYLSISSSIIIYIIYFILKKVMKNKRLVQS